MIPANAENIMVAYNILIQELKKYNPDLLDKKRLLIITKSDLINDNIKENISESINIKHLFISSLNNQGISHLKDEIWKILIENND